DHLTSSLQALGVEQVVIAGYANAYSNYVATREEYQAQHYEGASTLFGEHTLAAYKQVYSALVNSLANGEGSEGSIAPRLAYPTDRIASLYTIDRLPRGRAFGEVLTQPSARYTRGST